MVTETLTVEEQETFQRILAAHPLMPSQLIEQVRRGVWEHRASAYALDPQRADALSVWVAAAEQEREARLRATSARELLSVIVDAAEERGARDSGDIAPYEGVAPFVMFSADEAEAELLRRLGE